MITGGDTKLRDPGVIAKRSIAPAKLELKPVSFLQSSLG